LGGDVHRSQITSAMEVDLWSAWCLKHFQQSGQNHYLTFRRVAHTIQGAPFNRVLCD
jgi:hypothetical protein